jgi:hypothetical protein
LTICREQIEFVENAQCSQFSLSQTPSSHDRQLQSTVLAFIRLCLEGEHDTDLYRLLIDHGILICLRTGENLSGRQGTFVQRENDRLSANWSRSSGWERFQNLLNCPEIRQSISKHCPELTHDQISFTNTSVLYLSVHGHQIQLHNDRDAFVESNIFGYTAESRNTVTYGTVWRNLGSFNICTLDESEPVVTGLSPESGLRFLAFDTPERVDLNSLPLKRGENILKHFHNTRRSSPTEIASRAVL